MTAFKLPPDLIDRVDEARLKFDFPPTRTDVVERALEDWLQRQKDEEKRNPGRGVRA